MGSSIEIAGVTKTFASSGSRQPFVALNGIDLKVEPGEFVVVVGPSGCGKSTLLSILSGLEPASSGSVLVGGQPVRGPHPKVGVVFQDYALFPWMTVKENIAFGPRSRGVARAETEETVRRYIQLAGLTGFEGRYPHQLSGGMRQRCALVRTLANEPDVLLMDEPLAALDAQTRTILQSEILRIWGEDLPASQRRTVFFVTHGIDEAVFLADRIVVMSRLPGRIRADIRNTLPRPRLEARALPGFTDLCNQIWKLIEREAREASAAG